MVKCKIRFDKNLHGIYYSGEQVTGKVEFTFLKEEDVQAITLNISGRAKTKWAVSDIDSGYNWYAGKEQYIDSSTLLVGSPGGGTITLEPGDYTYTFSYKLLPMLPSSFEGEHGNIRYLVKVTLERPRKSNQTYFTGFTVLKEVDLKYEEPYTKLPRKISTSKSLWSGFFTYKPFFMEIKIPHLGFVSGQVIPVTLNVKNESSTNVKNVQINLKQVVTFKTIDGIHFTDTKTNLSENNYGEVQGRAKRTIQDEIRVPPVPPSSKNSCSIIKIDYKIQVVIYYGWIQKKFKMDLPIIIGTLLLSSAVQQPDLAAGRISDNTPELSPPSYEEAVQLNWVTLSDEDEHPMEKSKFLPRYPVYTFNDKSTVHKLKMHV